MPHLDPARAGGRSASCWRLVRRALLLAAVAVPCLPVRAERPPAVDPNGDEIEAGASHRLGTLRYRMAGGMTFGVNEGILLSAGAEELTMFETATGRRLRSVALPEPGLATFFVPPGSKNRRVGFALRFSKTIRFAIPPSDLTRWNLVTGELLSTTRVTIRGDDRSPSPRGTAVTPDGKVAILGFWNGPHCFVAFVDPITCEELHPRQYLSGELGPFQLSPDGQSLAVATSETLYLWRWREEKPAPLPQHPEIVSLAFSPDGALLAEGFSQGDKNQALQGVVIRDGRTGAIQQRLSDPSVKMQYASSLAFSPDGTSLAVGSYDAPSKPTYPKSVCGLRLWDVKTGKLQRSIVADDDEPKGGLTFFQDGTRLLYHEAGMARVLDLATGRPSDDTRAAHRHDIRAIRWSHDGQNLVSLDTWAVAVWDVPTCHLRQVHRDGPNLIDATLSLDGKRVACLQSNGHVQVREMEGWKPLHGVDPALPLSHQHAIGFSDDGQRLVAWKDKDAILRVRDLRTGQLLSERLIAAAAPVSEGAPAADKDPTAEPRPEGSVWAAAFTAGARRLLIAFQEEVVIVDVETGKRIRPDIAAPPTDLDPVRFAIFQDSVIIPANGVAEQEPIVVRRHDRELFRVPVPAYSRPKIAFSNDGRLAAVAFFKPAPHILLLDGNTGQELRRFEGFHCRPCAVSFSPDGRLACGLTDGTILIWDRPTEPQ